MAKQHFYSRVPAKVSMFNRTDGYDTFAHSEGLSRNFIDSELSNIYNYKPAKDESELIRAGKLPPVYFQLCAKSGELIQSKLTYLQHDYTRERTCYTVHSLILDANEKKNATDIDENGIFNSELFVSDLSDFDLTSLNSHSDDQYPEKKYQTCKCKLPCEELSGYNTEMMKYLIFALLSASLGKGKSVYLNLPGEEDDISPRMIKFLNSLFLIFPYNIREKFSFVTYTPDAQRYSVFKIKGLSENAPEIPVSKGITFHFESNICIGLQDNVVKEEEFLVNFFYELIGKDVLRREFLRYMATATEKNPELYNLNFKTLKELVIIFCTCSGMFDCDKILPNDTALTDYITAYEKHRTAVWDEYRADAFTCLKRFPAQHKAIPTKIFTKLNKMYKDELPASKHTLMLVMLDLIHTDAMRSKLFNFIKNNYRDEDENTKSLIIDAFSRVYYGGFLRAEILSFFAEIFDICTEKDKEIILEKLFLTLRTKNLSEKICEFFIQNYSKLNETQKKHLYSSCAEVLCDGDLNAKEYLILIDSLIDTEAQSIKDSYCDELFKQIEKEQRTNEHKGFLLIAECESGFTKKALSNKIFGDWSKRKIFGEYISLMPTMNIDSALSLIKKESEHSEITDDVCNSFGECLKKCDVPVLLDSIDKVNEKLDCKNAKIINKNVTEKAICSSIPKILAYPNGIELLSKFAQKYTFIKECDGFETVKDFTSCSEHIKNSNFTEFFTLIFSKEDKNLIKTVLLSLEKNFDSTKENVAIKIAKAIVANKSPDYMKLYNSMSGDDGFEANCKKLEILVELIGCALNSDKLPEEHNLLDSSLKQVANSLVTMNSKQGERWLSELRKTKVKNQKLKELLEPDAQSSGGFFSRLFKKK